jgi:hypothetical protein
VSVNRQVQDCAEALSQKHMAARERFVSLWKARETRDAAAQKITKLDRDSIRIFTSDLPAPRSPAHSVQCFAFQIAVTREALVFEARPHPLS